MKFIAFYIAAVLASSDADDTLNSTLHSFEPNPHSNWCALPNATDEDKSYLVNCDKNFPSTSTQRVPETTTLWFACNPGYGHDRFQAICTNGSWIPPISQCPKKCAKPHVPSGITYKCFFEDNEIRCNDEYLVGTKLRISCSLPYHHSNHEEIVCNEYGEWNLKNTRCVADCGRYSEEAQRLYRDKYLPWHVLLKNYKNNFIVSGTLITPNLVLTLGKSVTSLGNTTSPTKHYEVIVNGFLDEQQKAYKIKEIYLPPRGFFHHADGGTEFDDIAVLQLTDNVPISSIVQPVCVDWTGSKLPPTFPSSVDKMVRVGDRGTLRPVHNITYIVNIQLYNSTTCVHDFQQTNLAYDRFCAKIDGSVRFGEGDFGGGYYVKNPDDNLFYIKGVSVRRTGWHDKVQFTNVTTHIDWINAINEKINGEDGLNPKHTTTPRLLNRTFSQFNCYSNKSGVEEATGKPVKGCQLPIKNVPYFDYKVNCPSTSPNDTSVYCEKPVEGALVPDTTVLITICGVGYELIVDQMEKSICVDGQWVPDVPHGKKTCRKL